MVPFQVVEVVNIPETLQGRFASRDSSAASYRGDYQQLAPASLETRATAVPAPSKLVRTKYGAWYLPPRSWKLRKKEEVNSGRVLWTSTVMGDARRLPWWSTVC